MKKAYIFLADGFEEVEGLTVVDLLRRAGIDTIMVSITEKNSITGAHNIQIIADCIFEYTDFREGDAVILPGGMPGTTHLMNHEGLRSLLKSYDEKGKLVAAICAAPTVLGAAGLLKGKKATCYPGMENKLVDAEFVEERVVQDGNIITSRGVGTAIPFALSLISVLINNETAEKLKKSIVYGH